jgi:hypothetical protein
MAETVADFPVEPLIEWWVSRIYGYPVGGINGITTALRPGYELAKRRCRSSEPGAPRPLEGSLAPEEQNYHRNLRTT